MDRKRIILYASAAALLVIVAAFVLLILPGIMDDGIINVGICISEATETAYAKQLESVLTEQGYAVQIVDANNDQSVQNEQINTFIKEKYDALVVSMVMTSTAEELTQTVKKAGIPTVLIGSEPESASTADWEQICFVGCDLEEPGTLQGRLVATLPNRGDINDDGVVSYILLQDNPEKITTGLRTDSAVKAIFDSGVAAAELAKVSANGDLKESRTQTAKLLSQMGKDIEVVLCNNDEMALGALEAITDGGRTVGTDIYVLGIGGIDEALQKVNNGELTATVTDNRQAQADKIAEVIGMLLGGEAVEKQYYIPHTAVTAENAG